MKNKKGFTLIELLAVLVVLAILALISIPITIRIINNARENSYKRSIAAYGRAVEEYIGEYLSDHDINYNNITYDMIKDNIKINGNSVECDKLQFKSNGDIVLRRCHTSNSKMYRYENRQVKEDAYEVGEELVINNVKFHVIERSDSSKDYIIALKDTPLTYEELREYGDQGWANSFGQIPFRGYGYNSSLVANVVNNWADAELNNEELNGIRLITIEELANLGYQKEGSGEYDINYNLTDSVPKWVYEGGPYWTNSVRRTSSGQGQIWVIKEDGSLFGGDMFYYAGGKIRPVINIDKDKID